VRQIRGRREMGCRLALDIHKYPDGCYAVVDKVIGMRGPCANSGKEAIRRYKASGLIKSARTDKL